MCVLICSVLSTQLIFYQGSGVTAITITLQCVIVLNWVVWFGRLSFSDDCPFPFFQTLIDFMKKMFEDIGVRLIKSRSKEYNR